MNNDMNDKYRVNGEVCVQRGKKLHGGDEFGFDGKYYEVVKK